MSTPLKYPIGIQSFEDIRRRGYVYIDKTRFVYELATYSKYIFLSRPRRFGKSLLLSTFAAYFEGKKELFKGLDIEKLETEWETHPVMRIDLSGYNKSGKESLEDILERHMSYWEKLYDLPPCKLQFADRFYNIIQKASQSTGKGVVILIDEYDGPLISHLDNLERMEPMRDLLKSVYSNLKSCDEYIHFAMVTGVSRFSKVTIFSGLNNLDDISLDRPYTEICGITKKELLDHLMPGVEELAADMDISTDNALQLLKDNYDGYHFSRLLTDIYNPFSLLLALKKREISSYWFDTARPQFVVDLIRKGNFLLPDFINCETTASTLSDVENYRHSPEALLYQTGYLTIKGYDPEFRLYRLGIPNREVEDGFFKELAVAESGMDTSQVTENVFIIRKDLSEGNVEKALQTLKAYMAGIPYHLTQNKPEIYFENNLYLILSLAGVDTQTEWPTSCGRIDLLLKLPKYIYIFELKLDSSSRKALKQIADKDYAAQFATDPRKKIRVGINISTQTHSIDSWTIK